MADLVTDPNDPRLGHGIDKEQIPQHEAYLVLSKEERAKGYKRPIRTSYTHKGRYVGKNLPRPLTPEEHERYDKYGYKAYIQYEKESIGGGVGTYLTEETQEIYDDTYNNGYMGGCGASTKMSIEIAETYALNPKFYGATYCVRCGKHLNVDEFVWDGTDQLVGS